VRKPLARWFSDRSLAAYAYQEAVSLLLAILSRKNSLFAGSDEGGETWASLASLVETCKLNSADPHAYLTELLTRLVNGWPRARIDELMPWRLMSDAPA
jgi:IS66 C-terminal element